MLESTMVSILFFICGLVLICKAVMFFKLDSGFDFLLGVVASIAGGGITLGYLIIFVNLMFISNQGVIQ